MPTPRRGATGFGNGIPQTVNEAFSPSQVQLYWVNAGSGTIRVASLDGAGVTTLVTGQHSPTGVAVGPRIPAPGGFVAAACP